MLKKLIQQADALMSEAPFSSKIDVFRIEGAKYLKTAYGEEYSTLFERKLSPGVIYPGDDIANLQRQQESLQSVKTLLETLEEIEPSRPSVNPVQQSIPAIEEAIIKRISDQKIQVLALELNRISNRNPNSAALAIRTILLLTLRNKLRIKSYLELTDALNQAISKDIYKDPQVKKILIEFAGMPKQLLDATHHSSWILIKDSQIRNWATGLEVVIAATFR